MLTLLVLLSTAVNKAPVCKTLPMKCIPHDFVWKTYQTTSC